MNAWLYTATSLTIWVIGLLALWQRAALLNAALEKRRIFRQLAFEAVKELARLSVEAKSENVRIAAIRELLDLGFGKATRSLDGTFGTEITAHKLEAPD